MIVFLSQTIWKNPFIFVENNHGADKRLSLGYEMTQLNEFINYWILPRLVPKYHLTGHLALVIISSHFA